MYIWLEFFLLTGFLLTYILTMLAFARFCFLDHMDYYIDLYLLEEQYSIAARFSCFVFGVSSAALLLVASLGFLRFHENLLMLIPVNSIISALDVAIFICALMCWLAYRGDIRALHRFFRQPWRGVMEPVFNSPFIRAQM
jgi:hypothetical protein